MQIACLFEWTSITAEQVKRLVRELAWEDKLQDGNAVFEAQGDRGSFCAIHTWKSEKSFELFLRTRLSRVLMLLSIPEPVKKTWVIDTNTENEVSYAIHQMVKSWQSRDYGRELNSN